MTELRDKEIKFYLYHITLANSEASSACLDACLLADSLQVTEVDNVDVDGIVMVSSPHGM